MRGMGMGMLIQHQHHGSHGAMEGQMSWQDEWLKALNTPAIYPCCFEHWALERMREGDVFEDDKGDWWEVGEAGIGELVPLSNWSLLSAPYPDFPMSDN